MLRSVEVSNFKCFTQGVKLRFGSLTLLTGFNAAGKSSALQPLLLAAQTYRRTSRPQRLALNGELVQLGTVGDIIPANSSHAGVKLLIDTSVGGATWELGARPGNRFLALDSVAEPPAEQLIELLRGLVYLSAVRGGTLDVFPIPENVEESSSIDVGVDGRFAPFWLDRLGDEEVEPPWRHPNEEAVTLRKQLDAWFSALFPGAQANAVSLAQVSLENLQFRTSDAGAWQRPANVGYGFTYAFPIILALLAPAPTQVVIIDSPEAHLHPYAQSQMGRMLAVFAAAGAQIVVETHSDHLLNGVRLAVKDGLMAHEDLMVHFFSGASERGHGVTSPSVDSKGSLSDWPEGFFDQSERDLGKLAGWDN